MPIEVIISTYAQTLHYEIDSLSFSLRSLGEIIRLDMWQPSSSVQNGGHVTCVRKAKVPRVHREGGVEERSATRVS